LILAKHQNKKSRRITPAAFLLDRKNPIRRDGSVLSPLQ
jgi:hypothetical protein